MILAAAATSLAAIISMSDADPQSPLEGPLSGERLPVAVELDNAHWFGNGPDYIAVETQADAPGVAQALRLARLCFSQRFGEQPAAGAVMATGLVGLFEELPEHRQGWILPWNFQTSGLQSGHGIDGEDQASSLRHELGHMFLLNTLLPNLRKNQYGGDAPDWLDEAAGVAMESRASRADRRRRFAALVAAGRLEPLGRFVEMGHPIFASPRVEAEIARAQAASPGKAIVLEFTVTELGLTGSEADDFYAQTGGVIDFLDELGDTGLLGRIARDVRDTSEASGWLDRLGPRHGLHTRQAWDVAFSDWATARGSEAPPSRFDCEQDSAWTPA